MGMYVAAKPLVKARELNQGDILAKAPRLLDGNKSGLILLNGVPKQGDRTYTWPPPDVELLKFNRNVRVAQQIELLELALVVSNSCDNTDGGSSLELAPVKQFVFGETVDTDALRWEKISYAATSTNNPKTFYLPESPEFGFGRSKALLGDRYYISPELFDHYLKKLNTKRLCGIAGEAVQHLQWQLSMVYSRHPREDHDWPSEADLKLKMEFLKDRILAGTDPDGDYAQELAMLEKRFAPVPAPAQAEAAAAPAKLEVEVADIEPPKNGSNS